MYLGAAGTFATSKIYDTLAYTMSIAGKGSGVSHVFVTRNDSIGIPNDKSGTWKGGARLYPLVKEYQGCIGTTCFTLCE